MFERLTLGNIKGFEEAVLPLSPFTVLLGTNAAGKSNIRDALRFLHGISRGYKLVELFAGKYEGSDRVWAGVRGGPNQFIKYGSKQGDVEVVLSGSPLTYHIRLQDLRGKPVRVHDEWLREGDQDLFSSRDALGERANMRAQIVRMWIKAGGDFRKGHTEDILSDEPAITQIGEFLNRRNDPNAQLVRSGLETTVSSFRSMRFLDLSPNSMREPTYPGPLPLGDAGENLSTVLQNLIEQEGRDRDILEWLRVLTPMDVASLDFEKDARGRVSLVLVEHSKRRTPAESASDGTLRFLAYLALAFSTKEPTICFVEEIDNGIHPSRLQLLVDLIESQTKEKSLQVIASSHSPMLMNLLGEESLENSILVYRTEGSGTSKVKLLRSFPHFDAVLKKRSPGALMETGWFESMVESIDYQDEDDEDDE